MKTFVPALLAASSITPSVGSAEVGTEIVAYSTNCSNTCSVHDYRAFRLEDLQLFGWELSAAEMAAINKLDVAAVAPDDPVKGV